VSGIAVWPDQVAVAFRQAFPVAAKGPTPGKHHATLIGRRGGTDMPPRGRLLAVAAVESAPRSGSSTG
jgi:hypothetical protein